jgi:hypothetical protein
MVLVIVPFPVFGVIEEFKDRRSVGNVSGAISTVTSHTMQVLPLTVVEAPRSNISVCGLSSRW